MYKWFHLAYINKGHNAPSVHMLVVPPTTNTIILAKDLNTSSLHTN